MTTQQTTNKLQHKTSDNARSLMLNTNYKCSNYFLLVSKNPTTVCAANEHVICALLTCGVRKFPCFPKFLYAGIRQTCC